MKRVIRQRDNLKVAHSVVVFDAVLMVNDHAVRDGADKGLDDYSMNLMELTTFAVHREFDRSPSNKDLVSILVGLERERFTSSAHSTKIGNLKPMVKRENLPSFVQSGTPNDVAAQYIHLGERHGNFAIH